MGKQLCQLLFAAPVSSFFGGGWGGGERGMGLVFAAPGGWGGAKLQSAERRDELFFED
jgi:hypothetical protein